MSHEHAAFVRECDAGWDTGSTGFNCYDDDRFVGVIFIIGDSCAILGRIASIYSVSASTQTTTDVSKVLICASQMNSALHLFLSK